MNSSARCSGRGLVVKILLGLVIVIGIGAGLVVRYQKQAMLRAESTALSTSAVTVVSAMPAKSGGGLAIPGEIKPWIETPIYSRANGYLKRRFVDIGSEVREGQTLAEIDTPEARQDLERARAQLAQAEASLGLAGTTAARWEQLSRNSSVSDQEVSEKIADHKLKAALADAARAEVRRLQQIVSFSRITAPFNGIITARGLDAGDLVVAGSGKELFHLAQVSRLRVFVQAPQTLARAVVVGQSAEVSLPEFPGRTFTAEVIRTAGAFTDTSRTMQVELEVDNTQGKIMAGGFAQVRFPEAKPDKVLTLPANTLLFRPDGPQVGLVLADGTVELRKVKLGRDFGQAVEIAAGINAKDRVIMNPSDSLTSGSKVTATEFKKAEKPTDAKPQS